MCVLSVTVVVPHFILGSTFWNLSPQKSYLKASSNVSGKEGFERNLTVNWSSAFQSFYFTFYFVSHFHSMWLLGQQGASCLICFSNIFTRKEHVPGWEFCISSTGPKSGFATSKSFQTDTCYIITVTCFSLMSYLNNPCCIVSCYFISSLWTQGTHYSFPFLGNLS